LRQNGGADRGGLLDERRVDGHDDRFVDPGGGPAQDRPVAAEAVAAAAELEAEGVSAEVIDPRTLVPLDTDAVLRSVAKTGHLVIAEPAHRTCGAAAEISAIVAEEAFDALRAPILRVTAPNMQIPFSPALEKQMYPTREGIANAARRVLSLVRL
jgi:pyruvate dehydrogenase E1 component beta subunit